MKEDTQSEIICCQQKVSNSACAKQGFFREYEGKNYCVLHYPSPDKSVAFHEALIKKLEAKDFNFNAVWFPDTTNFEGFHFGSDVTFRGATFNANTYFGQVHFKGDVDFTKAKFNYEVYFYRTLFNKNVSFYKATFNMLAYFGELTFASEVNFRSAIFKDYVRFVGASEKSEFGVDTKLNLYFTHVEKPERVSFHTLSLRPRWFINIDTRKFEFTDIKWFGESEVKEELNTLKENTNSAHKLLTITYRQLAINAEENHRYREASQFRYNAFETSRIENFKGFVPWKLDWWYWLASGYGESIKRAFFIYIVLIGAFSLSYMYVSFEATNKTNDVTNPTQIQGSQLNLINNPDKQFSLNEAIVYSISTSILQKPEPKPSTITAKFLVLMETILGPAQIALLALALRRRFIR